jgi:hypothetical protein
LFSLRPPPGTLRKAKHDAQPGQKKFGFTVYARIHKAAERSRRFEPKSYSFWKWGRIFKFIIDALCQLCRLVFLLVYLAHANACVNDRHTLHGIIPFTKSTKSGIKPASAATATSGDGKYARGEGHSSSSICCSNSSFAANWPVYTLNATARPHLKWCGLKFWVARCVPHKISHASHVIQLQLPCPSSPAPHGSSFCEMHVLRQQVHARQNVSAN